MGFEFQYAKKGLLVLTKWLPEDCESRLPKGPSHQVGIGALILHPITGKMLVVQEKSGPASVHKLWKMPTGLTDPGEDVVDAAVREVKEETGLDVIFDRIVCIRQAHGGGEFTQSDMFFVCLVTLNPKYEDAWSSSSVNNGDIPLVAQVEEIAMIDWMEVEEYSGQELWCESPLYQEMNAAIKRTADEVRKNCHNAGDDTMAAEDQNGMLRASSAKGNEMGCSKSLSGMICKTLPLGYRDGSNTIFVSNL